MVPLYSEEYAQLIRSAAQKNKYIAAHYCNFVQEEEWRALYQIFSENNPETVDELLSFALDVGRLIGRAEETLDRMRRKPRGTAQFTRI